MTPVLEVETREQMSPWGGIILNISTGIVFMHVATRKTSLLGAKHDFFQKLRIFIFSVKEKHTNIQTSMEFSKLSALNIIYISQYSVNSV